MPTPREVLLFLILLPAVVTAVIVLAARGARWGIVLGVGAGYLAMTFADVRPTTYPAQFTDHAPWLALQNCDVTDRVPWLVLAAIVLALLEAAWPRNGRLRTCSRFTLAALTVGALLGPWSGDPSSMETGVAWLAAGLAAVVWLSWENADALAGRSEPAVLAASFAVVAAATGIVCVLSGLAIGAKLGAGLAAALATASIITMWISRETSTQGLVAVTATVVTSLILLGRFYAEAPLSSCLVLAASPFAAWVGRFGPIQRLASGKAASPWKAAIITALVTLIPAGVAVGLAYAAMPESEY